MLKTGTIAERLYRHLLERSRQYAVEDVRIGASYVAVVLEGGFVGVAARLKEAVGAEIEPSRVHGRFTGRPVDTLLDRLVGGTGAVDRALGLAAANALIHPAIPPQEEDTIGLMNLRPGERVAMVGLFRPIVARIAGTGANLEVVEIDTGEAKRREVLEACDVAIITATTLLNRTLEEILNELGHPRHVALIGPSTPLCEEIVRETPVTHLGGAAVADADRLLRVVSEGGGTPAMRPCLRFVNIMVPRS
jgi:uncharacterized protein (DUF4213/DUF364 family)